MEITASPPVENLPKREEEEIKGITEIGDDNEEHDDCYEIEFTDDDDDDENFCYVIDHSNHGEHYVISHYEVIADEGYDDGDDDDDEYSDSDYDNDVRGEDDSDDESCYEINPTEFTQKISIQFPDDALAT